MCRWKSSLHPFPILFDFFWLFFAFFSGFCQFWEQSANENLPYILSPYYLIFFWLFIVFFSGFLPVLRTICRWKPSLPPFPILLDFFLQIIFCFFLRVLASFENNLQMRTFPASFPHTIWCFSDYFLSLDFVFIIFCFFVFLCFLLFWIKSLFFGVCGVCGFTTLVYLIPRSESDTASVWEQLRKILAALWSEERLCWFEGWILKSRHWTWKSLCKTNTDWLVLLKVNFDFSCFWADVPFRGFVLNDAPTRRPTAQVSAAHAASIHLRSSRSLHLSLRSTAQSFEQVTWQPVKHWLIKSCLIFVLVSRKTDFANCHLFRTTWKRKKTWNTSEVK